MAFDEAGTPLLDRFWSRVKKTPTCWNWTGHVSGGYGRIRLPGSARRVQVHRLAYELAHGTPIPAELQLDHLCRNQLCVRPSHLEPVTPAENTRRGESPSSRSTRTGLCVKGLHALAGSNVKTRPNGKRECRTCEKAARRKHRASNRDRINTQKRAAYAAAPARAGG